MHKVIEIAILTGINSNNIVTKHIKTHNFEDTFTNIFYDKEKYHENLFKNVHLNELGIVAYLDEPNDLEVKLTYYKLLKQLKDYLKKINIKYEMIQFQL